jgi:hypothetical protein
MRLGPVERETVTPVHIKDHGEYAEPFQQLGMGPRLREGDAGEKKQAAFPQKPP